MRPCLLLALIASVLVGCAPSTVQKPPPVATIPPAPAGVPFGEFVVGDPIVHENLTLFPIRSKTPKITDRFITLDEGLAAGSVKIVEVGDAQTVADPHSDDEVDVEPAPADESAQAASNPGDDPFSADAPAATDGQVANADLFDGEVVDAGDDPFGGGPSQARSQVNKLMVLNTSDKPLYLMPGEIIYGGQQNRTIGEELVIQPGNEPVPIDVYCVEQGRWSGRSIEGATEHLAASAELPANLSLVVSQTTDAIDLAKRGQQGEFIASAGQVSKGVRLAVHAKEGQGRVWEEVAQTNAKVGNDEENGDFVGAYLDIEVIADLKPYVDKLDAVGKWDQIVGVAVAIDGRMVSVDIFESTPLFRKFWPKLLKSYALDAATSASEGDKSKAPKSCAVDECVAFLKEMQQSKGQKEELANGQHIVRQESQRGVCFSYYETEQVEVGAGGVSLGGGLGGSFGGGLGGSLGSGGAVHSSGFAQ